MSALAKYCYFHFQANKRSFPWRAERLWPFCSVPQSKESAPAPRINWKEDATLVRIPGAHGKWTLFLSLTPRVQTPFQSPRSYVGKPRQ